MILRGYIYIYIYIYIYFFYILDWTKSGRRYVLKPELELLRN